MSEKCTKYEALFTFADNETFLKHVKTCEDCKKEQAIMEHVSELINEVKPYYGRSKKQSVRLKAACFMFAAIIGCASIGALNMNKNSSALSAEELGFPVDAYGFLMVD